MTHGFAIVLWLALGTLTALAYVKLVHQTYKTKAIKAFANGLIIAALIYILFAIAWGNLPWIGIEVVGVFVYGGLALKGARGAPWLVALGWGLHPVWDLVLHVWGPGAPVAPEWYAWACLSFDVIVAGAITRSILNSKR